MSKKYASTGEAARLLERTRPTVRAWIEAGLLKGARIGGRGHYRIDRADLKRLITQGTP